MHQILVIYLWHVEDAQILHHLQQEVYMAGGYTPSNQDVIDYVTTASEGDATDFGNLTVARQMMGGSASSTRAIFGGGYTSSVVNVHRLCDYSIHWRCN